MCSADHGHCATTQRRFTRRPRTRYAHPACGKRVPFHRRHESSYRVPISQLDETCVTWANWWVLVELAMERSGYTVATRNQYRQILRGYSRQSRVAPYRVDRESISTYVRQLGMRGMSSYHIAQNISVLRTVFDKFGNLDTTAQLMTPRRPTRLPAILSRDEVKELLGAAPTIRDRLFLSLLYGCGLKVSEACSLRWRDIDFTRWTLSIYSAVPGVYRSVALPVSLRSLLKSGADQCLPDAYVFPGVAQGRHLTSRAAAWLVRAISRRAGLEVPVTCMTLRHSYAVHALESGMNIRDLQQSLGHQEVKTTMVYHRCIFPARSPVEARFPDPAWPSVTGIIAAMHRSTRFAAVLRLRFDGAYLASRRARRSTTFRPAPPWRD